MRSGPNKTRAWRKIKHQYNPTTGQVERYGRRFRNAMMQFNGVKASGYPLLNGLMLLAGLTVIKETDTIKTQINEGEVIVA